MNTTHDLRFALVPAIALLGCAVGPDFVRPEEPKAARYTAEAPKATVEAGGHGQRFEEGRKLTADWWRLLECPALSAIVAETLANNPSLQAAQANLRRSQDLLRAGYGVFFPDVEAGAGVSRQQTNPIQQGYSQSGSVFNLFTLSASVSYTLDIWGGDRRQIEALAAQVDAQRYAMIGATITLTGNAVNTVIARAAYQEQLRATEDLIRFEKEQVRIGEAQARAGTVPYANVLSLKSQLAATEALLPPLRLRIDQADHLLAALAGRSPGERAPVAIALADLKLPRDVPVTLPSELVRRRPDILLAEAQLHAATADIGVATAALFPSLTLSGGYGAGGCSGCTSLVPGATAGGFLTGSGWNLGAGITAPIFQGGTMWYQRKAAIDAREQSLALYRQAVLSAFEQVADTLRGLTHDAEALKAQSNAVDTAKEALELVQYNYQAGIATYLQVLTADTQYLQAKLAFIQAVAQRLQDTVALYVALGGGWWNDAGAPS